MLSSVNGNREFYRELIKRSKDGIIMFDGKGVISEWNPAAEEITGYALSEVENKVFWEVITLEGGITVTKGSEIRLIIERIKKEYLDSSSMWQSEVVDLQIIRKDGEPSYVQLTIFPFICNMQEESGTLRFTGLLHDITEKKLIEHKLYEEKMMFAALIENLPVMVDAFDKDGNFIIWNKECEKVTGYQTNELVGKPIENSLALLYPDKAYRDSMTAEFAERGGNFRNWEIELTCKNGNKKIISWTNISEHINIPGIASWAVGIDVTKKNSQL